MPKTIHSVHRLWAHHVFHKMSKLENDLSLNNISCLLPSRVFRKRCVEIQDLNPLKPTGYVMHQQFNIQQLYALPTLYLCVLYLTENKHPLVPLTA
jgi:hypothetical protein